MTRLTSEKISRQRLKCIGAPILGFALFLSACESEAARKERLEALVERGMETDDDNYIADLSAEELEAVGEILDEKMTRLEGDLSSNASLIGRLQGYAVEDPAKADALTAECEALFGLYSDPANTAKVAACVDRAWSVK